MATKAVSLNGTTLYPSYPLTRRRIDIETSRRAKNGTLRTFYWATKNEWDLTFSRIPYATPTPAPGWPITTLQTLETLYAIKAAMPFVDEQGVTWTVRISGTDGLESALDLFRRSNTDAFYSVALTLVQV